MTDVVIVGASVGGVKTAQALRTAGFAGGIVLVEAEAIPHPYDKPPLSKSYLTSDADLGAIPLATERELDDSGIRLLSGNSAVGVDVDEKVLELDGGAALPYDTLVIATGSRARRSPWGEHPGIHVLRTSGDAAALRARLRAGRRLLIVGAGFVGAEVAATAKSAGVTVTMIDPMPAPMARALNFHVGELFARKHRDEGIRLLMETSVSAIAPSTSGDALVAELSDGTRLEVDDVLVGIGSVVNTEWLEDSRLTLGDGVRCDEHLAAIGVRDVFAVGDVCRFGDGEQATRLEHWTSAADQALIVAHNIVNPAAPRRYEPAEYVWSDQYDWKIQIVGRTGGDDHVMSGAPEDGRFAVTYSVDGETLSGAVIVNWPRALIACRRALTAGTSVAEVRDVIAALADSPRVAGQVG